MKKYLFTAVLIIMIIPAAFTQDSGEQELIKIIEESYKSDIPIWLLMERGKQAYSLGEYGLAARVFREVLEREDNNPDAEVWLAYVFEQEGELILAEKQYLKALEYRNQLYIVDDELEIMYRLAEIYRKTDQYGKYERILLDIVEHDETDNILNLQYLMVDALKDYGPDKMFELYRYTENRFNRARKDLGIFYYQTGRYAEAQINLVIPVISAASTGYDYIYRKTADYNYSDFMDHIANMNEYEELSVFLQEDSFFQSAYYLAAALYADGYSDTAENLWKTVVEYDDSRSSWRTKSARQLRSPFIEPIISHRS